MVTAVIFDLDDTLYDEIEYCKSGFWAVAEFLADSLKSIDAERIFKALWVQFTSGNRRNVFNAALDELSIPYDSKLIDELVRVYRCHVPQITLPADSRDILCQLRDKYMLGLITDGFLPAQRLKVQALGIEKYFRCIIYTEELGRDFWKPSPAGFEKILRILNAEPKNIVYVADNEKKDFIAPNKLGFFTVQLKRPARLHNKTRDETGAKAQYVIAEICQLTGLLEKL